jgi:hypothetical protein
LIKVLRWAVPKVRALQRAANVPSAGKNQSFVAASVRTQRARRASAQRLEDAMKFFRPFQHLAVAVMTLLVSAAVPHIGQTAEFTLMPSPQTVHIGHFASNLKPVLSIESGDTVTIETSSLFAPEIIDQSGVVPPSAIPQYQRDIFREVKDRGPSGHVLTGPIEIRGAMPGDVLEVRILEVELALDWGLTVSGPMLECCPTNSPPSGCGSSRSIGKLRPPR